MRPIPSLLSALTLGAASITAAPLAARTLAFHAVLVGNAGSTQTGSTATGKARVRVDTARQRVSVDLAVTGLTIDDLWDNLVAKPAGPIHFHEYPAGGGDATLVLPLPFGATYHKTATGFRVEMKDYDYAAGAKVLGSTTTFDTFVASLQAGRVILNVHTDRFNGGEISGTVAAG